MQTTGLFTVHKFEIPFDNYNEPIYLFPFGDIHRSAPNCDVGRWQEFLSWARNKDRAYFFGMGDYDDIASSSERAILTNKNLHDSTLTSLDNYYKKETQNFYDEIGFMKGRLIGLIEGNHYQELLAGMTTTQWLADKMECKYLGCSTLTRLVFRKKGRNSPQHIDIFAHHGKGAARLVGGSLNKVENMIEAANADIYLMGHDHKKTVGYVPTMELTDSAKGGIRLHNKKKLIARTGSFLKGYVDGKVSYVADMALNPTDLGVIKVELTPRRICKGKTEEYKIDIHTSI